ncbi:MAG: Spy/CpxP family protein refolding chaperone [Mesorhizobium sp.]|nr:Spy/CpxP family protein refolding chaperone [Mesorhizobium sp.]
MDPEMELPKTPEDNNAESTQPRKLTGWIVAGGVAAVLVVGAGLAVASDVGPGMRMGGHGGPHMMNAGFGGGFMEHGMERVLDGIDATPEQKTKIWKIVDDARAEMMPVVRDMRAARGEVLDLLAAPTVDRAAAETLRAERFAAMDAASRRMTTAVLDAAEVLTPEQRAKIAAHVKDRGPKRW